MLEAFGTHACLLTHAYDHLTLTRVLHALDHEAEARQQADAALSAMRRAGTTQYMPETLLTRARILRHADPEQACASMREAEDIIARCGIRLYAVDAALLNAQLTMDNEPLRATGLEQCAARLEDCRRLIDSTGYRLRAPELLLAEARLGFYCKQDPRPALDKSRKRLEEMSYWGLLPMWEQTAAECEYYGNII